MVETERRIPSRAIAAVLIVGVTVVGSQIRRLLMLVPAYQEFTAGRPWVAAQFIDNLVLMAAVVLALGLLHGPAPRAMLRALGLAAPIGPAVLVVGGAVVPMAIGLAATRSFGPEHGLTALLFMDVLSPVVEEIHMRGFGFWQLRRVLRWPFWAAMIPQALAFGFAHVDQGADWEEAAGIFAITFIGAVLFSWLLERWQSLWVPVLLHAAMNGLWDLFAVSNTAVGGWFPFALQLSTAAMVVVITLLFTAREDPGDAVPS